MKTFYHYLAEASREFNYRIRSVVDITDKYHMALIEKFLFRYEPFDFSKPQKTIMQTQPLGFPNFTNSEVWIIDFKTKNPLSPLTIQYELARYLNQPDDALIIRGENDPIETRIAEIEMEPAGEALLATTDADYSEPMDQDPSYGNEYNKKLLNYYANVSAEKRKEQVAKIEDKALFKWLVSPKMSEDFNKDIDTPKPVSGNDKKLKKNPAADLNLSPYGNFQTSKSKK